MSQEPTWPGTTLFAVTPSNSTTFPQAVRQLYVGTAGDVSVTTSDGVTVIHRNAVGYIGPFFITRVNLTGTTASDIVAYV
jgi:hypothetical protein